MEVLVKKEKKEKKNRRKKDYIFWLPDRIF